tara:strand:+ start:254 stop:874 length:621 start_codon:yes stop_codon:yes gene_type:complete
MELQIEDDKEIDIICVARQTSSRFPNKIFAEVCGKPMIQIMLEKLYKLKANIIFAIPNNNKNNDLYNYLKSKSIYIYRGSETNVLERFTEASKHSSAFFVQRFNCDNLLFDVDYMIKMRALTKANPTYDIYTNKHCKNSSGQSIEIIVRAHCSNTCDPSAYEREHIFPYFYRMHQNIFKLQCPEQTVFPIDTRNDLNRITKTLLKR